MNGRASMFVAILNVLQNTVSNKLTDIFFAVINDCGDLTNPENGMVSFTSTLQGSIATYTCNEGFTIDTFPASRICLQTGWSGSEPQCTSKHYSISRHFRFTAIQQK